MTGHFKELSGTTFKNRYCDTRTTVRTHLYLWEDQLDDIDEEHGEQQRSKLARRALDIVLNEDIDKDHAQTVLETLYDHATDQETLDAVCLLQDKLETGEVLL